MGIAEGGRRLKDTGTRFFNLPPTYTHARISNRTPRTHASKPTHAIGCPTLPPLQLVCTRTSSSDAGTLLLAPPPPPPPPWLLDEEEE